MDKHICKHEEKTDKQRKKQTTEEKTNKQTKTFKRWDIASKGFSGVGAKGWMWTDLGGLPAATSAEAARAQPPRREHFAKADRPILLARSHKLCFWSLFL